MTFAFPRIRFLPRVGIKYQVSGIRRCQADTWTTPET
jgi:hypothetical protein